MILPKPINTTRCEFRNINGISIDKQGMHFRDVFEQECDISADSFGLSETKLNQQNDTVSCLYHQTAHQAFGMHHRGVLGGSDINYDSPFRFGGTLSMAVDDTCGQVLNTISDSWGRWTALELQTKGGHIFFVYDGIPSVRCIYQHPGIHSISSTGGFGSSCPRAYRKPPI
jgi:hypothetical protein